MILGGELAERDRERGDVAVRERRDAEERDVEEHRPTRLDAVLLPPHEQREDDRRGEEEQRDRAELPEGERRVVRRGPPAVGTSLDEGEHEQPEAEHRCARPEPVGEAVGLVLARLTHARVQQDDDGDPERHVDPERPVP